MANDGDQNTQYLVFSRHRLHYGRLFFEVIAFTVVALLLGTIVALNLPSRWWPWLAITGGGMLLATSFIAYRLNRQEAAYARLLSSIEQSRTGWLASPAVGGVSSRHMMPVGIALVGIAIMLLSFRL
jgi:hypothetical protein